MFGTEATFTCAKCGESKSLVKVPKVQAAKWHIRDRRELEAYVSSLAEETHEWLLAFFVDDDLNLLAIETMARGDVTSCAVDIGRIYCRGRSLGARGFFLVHNHPSGDPTPSQTDRMVTARISRLTTELGLPLLDHVIVARNGIVSMSLE